MVFSKLAGSHMNSITEIAVPFTLNEVVPESRRLVGVLVVKVADMEVVPQVELWA